MSIDPLKALLSPPLSWSAPSANQAQTPTAGGFDALLEISEALAEPAAGPVAAARSAVHLAQLQLLHGLFDNGPADDLSAGLPAFQPLGGLLPPAAAQRQRLDNLYHRLQPTLIAPEPSVERSGEVPPNPVPPAEVKRRDIEQMIDRVARQVSLAPELIRSVVDVESAFDPQAVSPVGAQGLMQLMPATAAELGVQNSFDPQENLLGGSRYLKQLLDKYDGDLDRALAAYNWGQGNVDRKGLARMPEETRNYLVKVKARLAAQTG